LHPFETPTQVRILKTYQEIEVQLHQQQKAVQNSSAVVMALQAMQVAMFGNLVQAKPQLDLLLRFASGSNGAYCSRNGDSVCSSAKIVGIAPKG
jgi:hypothetical protein